MSKAFRNQIATIAALDGFASMLIDVIKSDELQNIKRIVRGTDNWTTPIKGALLQIKKFSRLAQLQCKGAITRNDYELIYNAIQQSSKHFRVPGDNIYSIISFICFSLIGFDDVVVHLKGVKKKLQNKPKIKAFEDLASAGFTLVQFFDPDLNSIESYEQAEFARKEWRNIFGM